MVILITTAVLIIICILIFLLYREKKRRTLEKRNISLIESMNLTGIPIISFVNSDKVINMILDTGSNTNMIDMETLKGLSYKESDVKNSVIGIAGETNEANYVLVPLTHNKKSYDVVCLAQDMSASVMAIKEAYGVTIHGILGTGFFTKYKYVLDFCSMIAYSKQKN